MISVEQGKQNPARRVFVKEVTCGSAGLAIAGLLAGLANAPILGAREATEAASPMQAQGVPLPKSKYSKYFSDESKPGRLPAIGTEQNFYFDFQYIKAAARMHDPHTHPHAEILGFFSTDPNSNDLGAEVEMAMGEDLERVVFTRAALLFLPADTIHSPLVFRNVTKPFIFLATAPVPKLVEKSYAHLLPEDQRQKPKRKTSPS
jgi:hypothetical protein